MATTWKWIRHRKSQYYLGLWTCGADQAHQVAVLDDYGNLVIVG